MSKMRLANFFTCVYDMFFVNILSGAEIGRFVSMLRNQSPVLKACAAFALLQVKHSQLGPCFPLFMTETIR